MKLDICIVEDSKMDAKILKLILETYLDERHIIYTIKTYDTGLAFFADYEEGYITPTTLFMDIFLPKSNGLEICRKMRHMGYSGDILITTETKDHAIDAFSVDARGYILKPYNAPDVLDVLERVCRYASIRTLTIKKQKRMIHIPLAEILYIESIAPNCTIHCLDNVIYTIRKKLDTIETEIDDSHFLRCHKSYLVNMDYISAASEDFELTDGTVIPIRKTETKYIKDAYKKFTEEHK